MLEYELNILTCLKLSVNCQYFLNFPYILKENSFSFVGFLYRRRNNALTITETELSAIAADPIHGSSLIPMGLNTPAATGIPTIL